MRLFGPQVGQFLAGSVEVGAGFFNLTGATAGVVKQPILLPLGVVALCLQLLASLLGVGELGFEFVELGVGVFDLGLNVGKLGLLALDRTFDRRLLDFELLDRRLDLVELLLFAVDLNERLSTLVFGVLDAAFGGLDPTFEPVDLAFDRLHLAFEFELFVLTLALDLAVERFEFVLQPGESPLRAVEGLLSLRERFLVGVDVVLNLGEFFAFVLQLSGLQIPLVLLFFLAQ